MRRRLLAIAALAACCCTLGCVSQAAATSPSRSGYLTLEASYVAGVVVPAVQAAIDASTQPGGPPRPLLAQLVRLIFHDCAGGDGCNGCLSLELPSNRGLETPVATLELLYDQLGLASKMSRADFWALSGVIAAQYALPDTAEVPYVYGYGLDPLAFRWGRVDCPTAPDDPDERIFDFPSPIMGYAGVMSYFQKRFDFTALETVAISGAHNLGRAHLANSGFSGPWSFRSDRLGSGYYANMVNSDLRWRQTPNPPTASGRVNYQWSSAPPTSSPDASDTAAPPPAGFDESGGYTSTTTTTNNAWPSTLIMLNTDMCLFKDLGTPNVTDGGSVACGYATCGRAPTWFTVRRYAEDEQLFLSRFARAYDKMMNVCGRRNDSSPIPCSLYPLVGTAAYMPPPPPPPSPSPYRPAGGVSPSVHPAYPPSPARSPSSPPPPPHYSPSPSPPSPGYAASPPRPPLKSPLPLSGYSDSSPPPPSGGASSPPPPPRPSSPPPPPPPPPSPPPRSAPPPAWSSSSPPPPPPYDYVAQSPANDGWGKGPQQSPPPNGDNGYDDGYSKDHGNGGDREEQGGGKDKDKDKGRDKGDQDKDKGKDKAKDNGSKDKDKDKGNRGKDKGGKY